MTRPSRRIPWRRSKASITAQTASSCISQPGIWNNAAPAADMGARRTASPWRAITSSRLTSDPRVECMRGCRGRGGRRPRRSTAVRSRRDRTRSGSSPPSAGSSRSPTRTPRAAPPRAEIEQPVREHRPDQRRGRAAAVPGRWRRRTATRASSPARAGRTAFPSSPIPKDENTWPNRRLRLGQRLVDRQPPRERSREHGEEVERDADDHPAPGDEVERVVHRGPVGPPPPDREHRGRRAAASTSMPRAHGFCARGAGPAHAATASGPSRSRARRSPRAGARCRSRRSARPRAARAATPIAARRGSSASSDVTASDELLPDRRARPETDGLRRQHLAVARDVGRDDRQGAGERVRQHHAEALAAEGRRHERLRSESSAVSSLLGRKPRMSMPSSATRSRVRSSRTASGSEPQICSRAPVRRGSPATPAAARAAPSGSPAARRT